MEHKNTPDVTRQLQNRSLRVVPISRDGNCLFRAVSHQMYHTENNHQEIRLMAVDHIKKNAEFYKSFLANENLDQRVKKMSKLGEWGDHLEIQAISEVYGAQIEIYCFRDLPTVIYCGDQQPKHVFRLFYNNLVHYDSIVEEGATEQQRATLKELIQAQKVKLDKLNALISRRTLKQTSGLTLKQIMEQSLQSLEKDFKNQTKITLSESDASKIEDDILKQVLSETAPVKKNDVFTQLISMGFSENSIIEAILNLGGEDHDIEKYVNFIMMNQYQD